MRIAFILAGTNNPSNSEVLGEAFLKGIEGAEITRLKLSELPLDHFDLSFYEEKTDQGPHFAKIRTAIEQADGVVIASPVWNFSVPAHLKNMIDRIGSFALDSTHSVGTLKGKPFYLVFTGGSPDPGWNFTKRTISHIPAGIRYFRGTIIGMHYEGRATKGRGVFGLVLDQRPEHLAIATKKGAAFGKVVARYAKDGTLPLKQGLITQIFHIGGKLKKKFGL